MGTPFQPIIKTYLHLTEFDINPKTRKVHRKVYKLPDVITSTPVTIRSYSYNAKVFGRRSKLPRLHLLAALFLRNEILGCMQQALDREGILRNFRREFPEMSAQVSRNYFNRYSTYTHKYNTGRLYARQPMPPLYSFYWTKDGYIRHPSYQTQLIGFEFCKRHLTKNKIADPRFFTLDEMNQLDEEEWHIPGLADIQKIEAEIKKPVYNSIEFPDGYGKNYNPI